MTDNPHLERLIATMARLRGAEGCEWDREQTHESLVRYLIEETFELVDAIESGDREGMREELGDVLYQLLFHADIAGAHPERPFSIDDVARYTDEKMRRRHPHVFADTEVSGVDEIKANWQKLKSEEKAHRDSVLDGVPRSLAGIARAREVLDKASQVGVELSALAPESPSSEGELGSSLLAIIDAARRAGLDPDRALRLALNRFEQHVRDSEQASRD